MKQQSSQARCRPLDKNEAEKFDVAHWTKTKQQFSKAWHRPLDKNEAAKLGVAHWTKMKQRDKVNTFCELNEIPVPDMKDNCLIGGHSRRRRQVITNLHYYRVEIFYQVVDSVIQEMNTRFLEVGTELLSCIACLHPRNSFSEFNVQKLVRLCDLYPEDFSTNDCIVIEQQLQNFIHNIQQDPNFSGIEDLGSFAQKIVETLKNQAYPLVYGLIEMTLVLPVATASVERVFSSMKMIKTNLRNRMGDEWISDSLVVYIEKDIFSTIENEQILQHFQKMKSHIMQLPPLSYPTTT
ncbi:uncharacterized protein LOC122031295 [Zingiber officinale]|uniref:uncharacterized protein LOC122031295 n=1 Tax=Zingiber officinale TaxID=94328 RepID=UPI001C4B34A0|nr:uncharacterized protein LOC122031295 [Zingiber officinale]